MTPPARLIILLGGCDLDWSRGMVEAILAHPVEIAAIVASTACALDLAAAIHAQTGGTAPLLVCRRPGQSPEVRSLLDQGIDLAVSVGFDFIVDAEFLAAPRLGTLNTHPAVLPLNRGCHHSFWGIMDGTPLGATLHWMDSGLDSGDIIDQDSFADDGIMTAETIQNRSNALCIDLLRRNLGRVLDGTAPRRPQGEGTYHSRRMIRAASTLDAADTIGVGRLLDLCRATACKDNGFVVVRDGRRFLVRARIEMITDP
jgi:methionyl-tRNA formyltransferase